VVRREETAVTNRRCKRTFATVPREAAVMRRHFVCF
jgi:hypothetical protein